MPFLKISLRILTAIAVLIIFSSQLFASRKTAVVIPLFSGDSSSDAASAESVRRIQNSFVEFARYTPLSEATISRFPLKNYSENGMFDRKRYMSDLKADLLVSVTVVPRGGRYKATIDIISNEGISKSISVESRLLTVVAHLVDREMTEFQKNAPLVCVVQSKLADSGIIDEGESAGLEPERKYQVRGRGDITVIETSRSNSRISMNDSIKVGDMITLDLFPDTAAKIKNLNGSIEREVFSRYAAENTVLSGVPFPEKRFVESIVIINPFANLILPGFGSYLSTSYMGFKNPEPSYAGIAAAFAMETYQLGYVPYKTKWNGNFFPWINDSDKSPETVRYHKFLWGTLPLTWSVAFCDQLAYQYQRTSTLPPLFENRNQTAFILSVIIPGGGLFYKGYRLAGWSFYLTEFSLAGYYMSHKGDAGARYALYGAGIVKGIECLSAVLLPPSYRVFSEGIGEQGTFLSLGQENEKDGMRWSLAVSYGW
jgi:hypothetical protein